MKFEKLANFNSLRFKGIYCLCFSLPELSVKVGKLGKIDFLEGNYVYVGSAQNGLNVRLKHYYEIATRFSEKGNNKVIQKLKKVHFHWHIDYVLPYSLIYGVYYAKKGKEYEDVIAGFVKKHSLASIDGFGATDSNLNSHLFLVNNFKFLENNKEIDNL